MSSKSKLIATLKPLCRFNGGVYRFYSSFFVFFCSCLSRKDRLDFGFGLDQATSIFNYLDVDNSGLVDKDDFVKAIKNPKAFIKYLQPTPHVIMKPKTLMKKRSIKTKSFEKCT